MPRQVINGTSQGACGTPSSSTADGGDEERSEGTASRICQMTPQSSVRDRAMTNSTQQVVAQEVRWLWCHEKMMLDSPKHKSSTSIMLDHIEVTKSQSIGCSSAEMIPS